MTHEGAFEASLVTLYLSYAEFTVNRLLVWIKETGLVAETPTTVSLGHRITVLRDDEEGSNEEIREVLRLISNNGLGRESTLTPQQLCELAGQTINWRVRLDVTFQKLLLPMLRNC